MKKIVLILIFFIISFVNVSAGNNDIKEKNNSKTINELKFKELEIKIISLEKELNNYNKLHSEYKTIVYWVIGLITTLFGGIVFLNWFQTFKLGKQEIENIENEIKNSSKKYLIKIQKDLEEKNNNNFTNFSDNNSKLLLNTEKEFDEKINKVNALIKAIIDSDKKTIEKFNNDIEKNKKDNIIYTNNKFFDIDRRFILSEIKKFRKEELGYIYEIGLINDYLNNSLEYNNYYIKECLKLLEEYTDNNKIIHNYMLVNVYELLEKIKDEKYKEQIVRIKKKIEKLKIKQ